MILVTSHTHNFIAIIHTTAPCYYHFRTFDAKTGLYVKGLIAVIIPVSPGRSRIFFELPSLRNIRKLFPTWVLHTFSNKFLDTDIWVHDQERFQRSGANLFSVAYEVDKISQGTRVMSNVGSKYVMTTQSDTGCIAWRKWWSKHMVDSPIFGEPLTAIPWLSKEQQLDRYEAHAKHCTSCNGALKRATFVKKYSPFVAILLSAIAPTAILKIFAVTASLIIYEVAERIRRSILGPERGSITSAAQFPEKPSKT